jgi:hypothetical protein
LSDGSEVIHPGQKWEILWCYIVRGVKRLGGSVNSRKWRRVEERVKGERSNGDSKRKREEGREKRAEGRG